MTPVWRRLPGQAGSALAFPAGAAGVAGPLGGHVLGQVCGGAVFTAYVSVVLILAAAVTSRRDIA